MFLLLGLLFLLRRPRVAREGSSLLGKGGEVMGSTTEPGEYGAVRMRVTELQDDFGTGWPLLSPLVAFFSLPSQK